MGFNPWKAIKSAIIDPVTSVVEDTFSNVKSLGSDTAGNVRSLGRNIDSATLGNVKSLASDTAGNLRSLGRNLDDELSPLIAEIATVAGGIFGGPQGASMANQIGQMIEGSLVGENNNSPFASGSGGGFGGSEGNSVAGIQAGGYQQALAQAALAKDEINQDFQPYLDAGKSAINPLKNELGIGGGEAYKNPLLDKIKKETMQKLFNQRTGAGNWSSGDTPGVVASALLQPEYQMQQNRIGQLQQMMTTGGNNTANKAGANTNILRSVMDSNVGMAEAMAAGQAVTDAQKGDFINSVGDILGNGGFGDIVGSIGSGIGSLLGFGGDSGGSESGGSWNFDIW